MTRQKVHKSAAVRLPKNQRTHNGPVYVFAGWASLPRIARAMVRKLAQGDPRRVEVISDSVTVVHNSGAWRNV